MGIEGIVFYLSIDLLVGFLFFVLPLIEILDLFLKRGVLALGLDDFALQGGYSLTVFASLLFMSDHFRQSKKSRLYSSEQCI